MAKKMISRLSVLAVLIVFLAACSKTMEYTNIIPADATVVTSINLKSLASKAGLNDKENEAAKQKVLEALKSGMNAATFQQLEKVMNNPSESGIDVEAPVYVFTSPSFPYSTAVAKIKSEDDLHASLEIMVKEQICQPINEAAGYSFTTMNGGLVAFNNSTVMLISVKGTSQIEKAKEGITNLLKQTADNSIAKSGAFQKMEKQKSDINFFASMAAIPAPYQKQVSMGLPAEVKAEDITIIAGLNFEKGRIALKTENYTENEAVKALMKKQLEAFEKAKLALRKKYAIDSIGVTKNGMEKANEKLANWLESDAGQAVTQSFSTVMSGMGEIFSGVSSLVQAELEKETAAINARYSAEISAAEGNNYKVAKLEKEKQAALAKAKNEANKKLFAMQVIQAVAQTAQNAISAYGSAAAIPVVGYIMAPIAAAMAIAAGMIQIAAIKKQQQASEAQGYAQGGFTPQGRVNEEVGIVHAGEWVASQKLLASPVARPLINALDYAQRTNAIGSLRADDVSRTIVGTGAVASPSPKPVIIQAPTDNVASAALAQSAAVLSRYERTMSQLSKRLNEPFVTVNTVTGDTGIKQAQEEYDTLIRNKSPKSRRK